jgi:hypothetical protein
MDNFIEVYKSVFSDEFCKQAIERFELAAQSGLVVNRQDHDGVPKLTKENDSFFMPEFPLDHTRTDLITEFNYVFWEHCYKKYAEKYSVLSTLGQHKSYTMKIQKTKPGQGYHIWHCEQDTREHANRLLTWTVYLNDEFEAGETEFLYQHYRYKPQKGDCIIFPAAYTHTHRGNPPIGGDKYIITGWVEF